MNVISATSISLAGAANFLYFLGPPPLPTSHATFLEQGVQGQGVHG